MSDCHTVLASDTHHRLRKYRFDNREDETVFTEEVPIISFRVHPNERFVLTTTQRNLRMWDLQTKTLVRNFYGAQQGNLVIHAGFGGINHEYLATGTEGGSEVMLFNNHKVIIWGVGNSKHALKLRGHRRVVNGVTWNPKYSTLLASCSQDGTVRIWNIARNNEKKTALAYESHVWLCSIPHLVTYACMVVGNYDLCLFHVIGYLLYQNSFSCIMYFVKYRFFCALCL
ncbi:unnamed protein product [Angiostrongylus costaricensis]|uniref:WD_REPEATS_REGION domain-containing protein n=1 Tax=Angiostrongylus costaricensis TaxID=334426 RepID=A0A0R3PE37_ANGCS|nr:unnamed protein product [Angiostrongylus costaricensis]